MANHAVLNDARILVVDDEPDLRTLYELTLLREGYRVETAADLAQAYSQLDAGRFDVLITDMRLPDGLGLALVQRIKAQGRNERCVVITAFGSAENAVAALKAGAFDYLTKPVDLKRFRTTIAAALATTDTAPAPAPDPQGATAAAPPRPGSSARGQAALERLVGQSACMRAVRERLVKVARSMAPVLIHGESGTGKELVAQAIHANSHRAGGPWVAVNCSAIPEHLLEAEFFGARKGAYTGAHQDRTGFFQSAQGGTLFLDEIGDLPLAMQSKLLRAIQERCVRPVGSPQEEPVDVRIISATHKQLQDEVQQGRFRQDLYYRLNVIDLTLPPLRERREDLPALCTALLQRIAQESGLPCTPRLSAHALEQLGRLALSGNVRELENLLHRAVALGEGEELELDAAPDASAPPPGQTAPQACARQEPDIGAAPAALASADTGPATDAAPLVPSDLQAHLDQQERGILVQALKDAHYNRTLAAQRLGISLRQMRYRIARLSIDIPGSSHDDGA
ncbi:MAG: sigma-54-dependent transcriptional regulator [Rhodoferax sp.]